MVNNFFIEQERKEQILKQHTIEEMLKIYGKILTSVSKLKLKDIDIDLDARFGEDITCCITIFNRKSGSNRGFTIYSFWSVEKSIALFERVFDLIKEDDFLSVISFKE